MATLLSMPQDGDTLDGDEVIKVIAGRLRFPGSNGNFNSCFSARTNLKTRWTS